MTTTISVEERARAALAGQYGTPDELIKLVDQLKRERRFSHARHLLERLRLQREVTTDPRLRLVVAQKLALVTYKDADLPGDLKFERALDILRSVEDLETTKDPETLGLAGAIYKRKWEFQSNERDLETSAAFYRRGFAEGVEKDFGYTAVNAAFVLDLLADLESPDGPRRSLREGNPDLRRRQAIDIREQIAATLPALWEKPGLEWLRSTWWFPVTLGEAFFGLRKFDEARTWLRRAASIPSVPDWEQESTARQLAALFNLMSRQATSTGEAPDPRAREVLRDFLKALSSVSDADAALDSVVRGKIGLALSGGGFRAALYHIGVLARLAELDLLRHVEYLSCVSGGSIVGAHYYLEVRHLLRTKHDADITRDDFIDIVDRVQRDFLAGVQRNIRVRVAAEWTTNLRLIFQPDYTRTRRAGELYEKEIFSRVRDGEGHKARFINELKIIPAGESADFRPKDHNWRRAAKVPILVLNATTLNTGHNWQFTASWMGEPPGGIDTEIDANYRLRRMYYDQAPPPHQRMRLGYAVAASACVPGIFEPLPLAKLYERLTPESDRKVRPVVRLVDGGVHDNQGTSALLEQGCSVLLVSDASGQMDHEDAPSNSLLGVPLRANSILQSRIRTSQYEDLMSRHRAGTLKGLMFVHLKRDLETRSVDWIGCQDPSEPAPLRALTSYGIQKGIQRRLAALRTDLDSFTDTEAFALMASGYRVTETSLKEPLLGFPTEKALSHDWDFLAISPLLEQPSVLSPLALWLERQLGIGSRIAFKVWFINSYLQVLVGLIGVAILGAVLFNWRQLFALQFTPPPITVGAAILAAGTFLLGIFGLGAIARLLDYRKTLRDIALGIGMAFFGFVVARLHLHVFDPLFLRQGRLPVLFGFADVAAARERERAERERSQSLENAAAGRRTGFAVQQSEGFMYSAKRTLDPETELKVTRAIFELSDGVPASDRRGAGLQLLPVGGTGWNIAYDVDWERQRVRIHHLVRAGQEEQAPS
ncbi:hypothetical protein GCM10023165_42100 [Variovorax defluvii]|uniref:PNPLA domain-containing protein n=1 Tax=Variovorax defluvii TaxID=913761 RepID=A0ABP8I703_9BURK